MVYQNLLDNAVKFMGEQHVPRIEVGAHREGAEVLCYVRDNGIGIEAEEQRRIFGLFHKLDPDAEGSGVGLAIA